MFHWVGAAWSNVLRRTLRLNLSSAGKRVTPVFRRRRGAVVSLRDSRVHRVNLG